MLPGHGRLSTSRTVSHKQSSGKIRVSIAAKLFGERALKNTYIPWYLVPGVRVPGTAVCVLYFKVPPFFAACYSYGNFLSAGLGSSPI